MTTIIWPDQDCELAQLGGKAGALYQLTHADVTIPAWFCVPPAACGTGLTPAPALEGELKQALQELCPQGEPVAVRSSALDEDGLAHAFAGQLESYLDIPPETVEVVLEKIVAVWRSGFSERVMAYRQEHHLPPPSTPPAVLVQRMVKADVSGVAFSADPVSGRRGIALVAAVHGSETALVSGDADADTFQVDRAGRVVWSERASPQMTLNEAQVQALAGLARQVAREFGRPQDIEWAITGDQISLLQARPITTLAALPDPDAPLTIWDNSNIAESYPDTTTPLTFSFVRRAYKDVYRQFCQVMGVPETTLAQNETLFGQMLGFIQGRIYYNLPNWYRLLALLPGYKLNRRFMEQMMGVKEVLPDSIDVDPPGRLERWRDGLHLVRAIFGLFLNYFTLPRQIEQFYQRLEQHLGQTRPDLSLYRPDELVALYRFYENKLLKNWQAPIINDFFAMIFYGLLRQLCQRWFGDENGALTNQLLAQTGNLISAEPARHLTLMSRLASPDPRFVACLRQGSLAQIKRELPRQPDFARAYQTYLDRFGDRCLEELKLESQTLYDDPLPLFRTVGQLAQNQDKAEDPDLSLAATGSGGNATHGDPNHMDTKLKGLPFWRRLLFTWVRREARNRVRDRENLRFERTRVFGRARQTFLELGRHFENRACLEAARDIFYLDVAEILNFIEGTSTSADLKGLVALRKAELEGYQAAATPADRFETHGLVYQGHDFQSKDNSCSNRFDRNTMSGMPASPGQVRGRVRMVNDPRQAKLGPGEIIIARRTDPGWIILFPAAAGLLVEHGSILSHAAIVSRELGLPSVIGLAGIRDWLKDGDMVEFDGSTGLVRRIEDEPVIVSEAKQSPLVTSETAAVAQVPSQGYERPY